MKCSVIASVILFSSFAFADTITCSFTEPFVSSVYDMKTSKLTYTDINGTNTEFCDVSFQIKGAALFELTDKNGTVLQSLNLNYNGSDGMSDSIYPYDVHDNSGQLPANYAGGCESDNLKATPAE
jgi:uncharacterized membrane protein